jgi:RHS repeat-associated protein
MKSLAPSNTFNSKGVRDRCVHCSRSEIRQCIVATLGALLLALGPHNANAQVGNDNPAGASGIFNGQAGGCGYDPYTGNATRSITDISVAGAVGAYPLALVRTANSRAPSTTEVFSWSGGWNHNYNWILEDSPLGPISPKSYTVEFPDGRVEKFRAVSWNPAENYYRVRPGLDTPAQTGSSGIRERFVPLSNGYCYLILPDGGKVEFQAAQHTSGGQYWYKYHVTAIYDPHGLKTTIASEVVGRQSLRRITQVTEPAGRYLQFAYLSPSGPKISKVTASDGRAVQYYYACCNNWALDHVVYYGQWTARYQYTNSNIGGELPPLLSTCDDPMYAGPMQKIAYIYRTSDNYPGNHPVYGQISSENYFDGTTVGAAVSTLAVGVPNNNPVNRKETRGDGATRTFIYNGAGAGYLAWASDFMGHQSSQTYDAKKYINSITNFNRIETDYTCDPITGNITQIKFPLTQGDTPGQSQRPTVNYTYTNNYYVHTIQGEAGPAQTTTFGRDGNNRVIRIDYPDGGYDTFGYDAGHFNQINNHRMTTGGTESWTYNGRAGLKDTYRNPDNATGNPTARYGYDTLDRLTDVTDVLGSAVGDGNHSISFSYNDRGQVLVTTLPKDINNGNSRHTITNVYNPDGTLQKKTDELGHPTNYAYDDYRRLTSVTLPDRGDGAGTHTTYYSYYDTGRNNYTDTNAQASYVLVPSGKLLRTVYDANWRKSSVTAGYGSGDDATTSYLYDGVGNVTWLTNPRGINTHTIYDERNRPSSITDALSNTTTFTYDTAGRQSKIARPNGQMITYDTFDNMNRVTQETATQSPEPPGITKYTYYPSGLLHTMQDPRLSSGTEAYTYAYDFVGRRTSVTYPRPTPGATPRTEQLGYDTSGRLQTFTNRNGKTQTFSYDPLNRMTGFSWNDNGTTPSVSFGYDAASRLTSITNANATISRTYLNDNLLKSETENLSGLGGASKTMNYDYNADGNRNSITYPDNAYSFTYDYTGRNQLADILSNNLAVVSYGYNENGDMTSRGFRVGGSSSSYTYDALDRVTHIEHSFIRDPTRTFDYDYDSVGNRKWTKRDGDKGDSFLYDDNDQVTALRLNVTTPESPPIRQTIFYDANGNRTSFAPTVNGPIDTYTINNLNEYTQRNTTNASYDPNGNLTLALDQPTQSGCIYDQQNRLTSATKNSVTMSFTYDGLNRQVSRTISGTPTYNVWSGWDLIMEYQAGGTTAAYLYGPDGVVKNLTSDNYYFHDASGSTSHLTNSIGTLLEWYRYDLQGAPIFYDANDNQRNPNQSAYGVRHLFTGQQWYKEVGLYDLRNRFYSPDIGRFLQPDPIGFHGGSNLYSYCRNNPMTRRDPFGLESSVPTDEEGKGDDENIPTVEPVIVTGEDPNAGDISRIGLLPGSFTWPGIPWDIEPFINPGSEKMAEFHTRDREINSPSVEHRPPSSVPSQNPDTAEAITADDILAGVDAGGIIAGVGEHAYAGPGYWLGADVRYHSSEWAGNGMRAAGRRATALRISKAFRIAGLAGLTYDAYVQGQIMLHDSNELNRWDAGFRLGMSGIGTFGGPPGFALSIEFFLMDETVGLDNWGTMIGQRMEEGFWYQPGP